MAGNSFPTPDGGHVSGTVAMALDAKGNAVPVEHQPITLEQFCRALAAHASIVSGNDAGSNAEAVAAKILAFARKDAP